MISYKNKLVLLSIVTLFFNPASLLAQDTVLEEHAPWLSGGDTNRYTSTGYIAASYCIIDGLDISNKNYGICLSGAMPIKRTNFGVAVKLGFSSAPLDFTTSRFNEYYAIAGPYFTMQLNPRYSFDVRALVGVTYTMYPEQDYSQTYEYINTYGNTTADSTLHQEVTIEPEKALIFMLQAGIGFKYVFTHNFGLMLNVDYTKRYSLSVTQNTTNISADVHYSYSNTNTISERSYTFPPNSTTPASYFGNNDPFGYTVFSLGIFYQIGDAVLKQ